MKIRVTMKDPDTLHETIKDAVRIEVAALAEINPDERNEIEMRRCDKMNDIASMWFKYGEYLTVEIDTDTKTIAVIPSDQT